MGVYVILARMLHGASPVLGMPLQQESTKSGMVAVGMKVGG